MSGPEHDARLKKLGYRAWHRGIREADLIVGPFADNHLSTMTAAELDEFERILEIPDQDLYAWIVGQAPVPEAWASPLMERLREFRFKARGATAPERWGG